MFQHSGFSRTFEALHWELWLFWRRCWCWELFSLIDGILTFRSCGFFSELDEFGVFLKLLCVEWISKLLLLTRRLPMGTLKLTGKGNCVNKTKQSQLLRENTHFVLNPDLRVQRLDNLVHEYFQAAKDCWHYWKNPNLANELSKPRIYTKYLSPENENETNQAFFRGKPKIGNQSQVHFRDYFSHSYLIVKEEIDGSYENTLKRVEEMRCDGPNCKTQPRST